MKIDLFFQDCYKPAFARLDWLKSGQCGKAQTGKKIVAFFGGRSTPLKSNHSIAFEDSNRSRTLRLTPIVYYRNER